MRACAETSSTTSTLRRNLIPLLKVRARTHLVATAENRVTVTHVAGVPSDAPGPVARLEDTRW